MIIITAVSVVSAAVVMLYYVGMPALGGGKLTLQNDGLDGHVTFELDDSKLAF